MPGLEALLGVLLAALAAAGAIALFSGRRGRAASTSAAAAALARGDFSGALAVARRDRHAPRDDLYTAAVAARHLLDLATARALTARLVGADPRDGEAWLEAGLAAAYDGDVEAAEQALGRAAALRADLLESITLHRAWLALARGDRRTARARFEEVEASLESKLRSDLGPGDPLFAEWFLQAAALWEAIGEGERAAWALAAARAAAPESRLPDVVWPTGGTGDKPPFPEVILSDRRPPRSS